jgi:hypothetical protein
VTSQLLVPFLANVIRREEKRVIKRFNLYFAMSTDASLDLGASPVSPVRASEPTNVMVTKVSSQDKIHSQIDLQLLYSFMQQSEDSATSERGARRLGYHGPASDLLLIKQSGNRKSSSIGGANPP